MKVIHHYSGSAAASSAVTCGFMLLCAFAMSGCQPGDPVAAFIQQQDSLPADQRVPDWDRTKRLMLRAAPKVGDVAPDFELVSLDGSRTIRMSAFHESRPLVLVFGSFT